MDSNNNNNNQQTFNTIKNVAPYTPWSNIEYFKIKNIFFLTVQKQMFPM